MIIASSSAKYWDWVIRIAFASVFLVNAVSVWIDPYTSIEMFEKSILHNWVPNPTQAVHFINLNDLLMGLLILVNRWNGYLLAGIGFWLIATTVVRLASLIPGGNPADQLNSVIDLINQFQ